MGNHVSDMIEAFHKGVKLAEEHGVEEALKRIAKEVPAAAADDLKLDGKRFKRKPNDTCKTCGYLVSQEGTCECDRPESVHYKGTATTEADVKFDSITEERMGELRKIAESFGYFDHENSNLIDRLHLAITKAERRQAMAEDQRDEAIDTVRTLQDEIAVMREDTRPMDRYDAAIYDAALADVARLTEEKNALYEANVRLTEQVKALAAESRRHEDRVGELRQRLETIRQSARGSDADAEALS